VLTITPTQAGVFSVVCNEFCGVGHHQMTGRIRVVEPGTGG
jgi:cytochrome c oxidase subunit 2